jgi:hypothetical protein
MHERFELSEFPHDDVDPYPLFRLEPYLWVVPQDDVEPSPLFLLKDELPGSEYDEKFLFTPPLYEQVPRPEFAL